MTALRLAGFPCRARRRATGRRASHGRATTSCRVLRNVGDAGWQNGVRVYVTVMSPGSRTTPLTDEARAGFASYAAAIVRGAPSLEARDRRQRAEPQSLLAPAVRPRRHERRARATYLALLAQTYDALKAVSPGVEVYGGACLPVEATGPDGSRPTHSPTGFIRELGPRIARVVAIAPSWMPSFMHPYTRTTRASRRRRAPEHDHDRRRRLPQARLAPRRGVRRHRAAGLRRSRSSTASSASSRSSRRRRRRCTRATEPTTTKPVDETTQATYYRQALALAFCQPTVADMLLFLSRDEQALLGLAVGHLLRGRHAEDEPRARDRGARPNDRWLDHALPRRGAAGSPTSLKFGTRSAAKRGVFKVSFACDLDCRYWVRLENAVTHATKLATKGSAEVGEPVRAEPRDASTRPAARTATRSGSFTP